MLNMELYRLNFIGTESIMDAMMGSRNKIMFDKITALVPCYDCIDYNDLVNDQLIEI